MSLKIKNLYKSYLQGNTRIEVLKNLNLDIHNQEIVSVLGQSGSGKSTLLSLISGLDKPDSGSITIDGVDIVPMNEKELTIFRSKKIGIVFQNFHLMNHLTALENVMLSLEILRVEKVKEKSKDILEKMGLDHRLNHFPYQLSGGECQRVAIARALVTDPSILLADEPSGSLDAETGKKMTDLLFQVLREKKSTAIIVTHNPELASKCDRQVKIIKGSM